MTGRVQGDTMVISPADLAAQTAAPLGGAPAPSVPVAPVAPAPAPAAIPTLGGSFTDTGSAVSAAWQSGRSVSEMLDELAAEPAAQPAPTMTRPVAETTQDSFTVP